MDRNVGVGLTKQYKSLKSNDSTYDRMRKVELRIASLIRKGTAREEAGADRSRYKEKGAAPSPSISFA
jgi:hypothetical protein